MRHRLSDSRRLVTSLLALTSALASLLTLVPQARGIGESTRVDVRGVVLDNRREEDEPRPSARQRIAWEARKRTSIETRLRPSRARLDDPSIFETPLLYLAGDSGFADPSEAEVVGLRRFVDFGGLLFVDDAEPTRDAFDASVRRLLQRAFPTRPLRPIPSDHTLFRSFYLLHGPAGRTGGTRPLEGIEREGRMGVIYSRSDMGGAWARDNLGTWQHAVEGGETQRELAIRLGVNVIMYALCLDYKDDQVHAPFIMRRRGGTP
ncbi:MAG: DUF4159 domain-containing protein [Myxococcales bacterium]|nr:DUF4159 domain-containing protein [Myxococcales bacterium]MCB9627453.1 DUF4159 domain-containing protein [Sandaracinaceae bacterium]